MAAVRLVGCINAPLTGFLHNSKYYKNAILSLMFRLLHVGFVLHNKTFGYVD